MDAESPRAPRQRIFRRRTAPGAAPGSIVSAPDAVVPPMQVFAYGPEELIERDISDPGELEENLGRHPVTWLNVDGVAHAETVERIGRILNLHPLALEDVVNVHQRAKVEDYEGVLFIVARMVRMVDAPEADESNRKAFEGVQFLETEQLSLFLGKGFVVTFQEEGEVDCLDPVRERLRKNHSRLRKSGPDRLAYAILDAVTDGYFPVLESYSDALEDVEDFLETEYDPHELRRIHDIRKDLLTLRRLAWPLREVFQVLQRDTYTSILPETRVFLRDCYDHTVQILDVLDTHREICADLREYYFSTLSQRTNDIVKVLTVISTIFIPLSFVAGLWGMNFDAAASPYNMPELHARYGYPSALGLMAVIVSGLLWYFWRKGWLGR